MSTCRRETLIELLAIARTVRASLLGEIEDHCSPACDQAKRLAAMLVRLDRALVQRLRAPDDHVRSDKQLELF